MYVCMYVRTYVRTYEYVFSQWRLCRLRRCFNDVCMYVISQLFFHGSLTMNASYARVCVCVCVCVYIYIYIYIHVIHRPSCFGFWLRHIQTHTHTQKQKQTIHIHSIYMMHHTDTATCKKNKNNCKFDRPLKNGWMRGIRTQGPFFTQLCKQELKKGPKTVSQRAVKFAIILQVAVP